jgi:hypothetical protein
MILSAGVARISVGDRDFMLSSSAQMRGRISSGIRRECFVGAIGLTLSVGLRVGQESGGEESEGSFRPAEVVVRVDMAKGMSIG